MSFLSQPITLQSLFGTKRMIGPINVQVVVNEETSDALTITKQPVQEGASITDHSFSEPTILTMNILQQNNSTISGLVQTFSGPGSGGLAQIYNTFLDLQDDRTPFTVLTPKRVYDDMLIAVLRMVTDRHTENILSLSVTLQQVLLVSVGTIQVPPSRLRSPKKTQATQNTGAKSALLSLSQGILPGTVGSQQ